MPLGCSKPSPSGTIAANIYSYVAITGFMVVTVSGILAPSAGGGIIGSNGVNPTGSISTADGPVLHYRQAGPGATANPSTSAVRRIDETFKANHGAANTRKLFEWRSSNDIIRAVRTKGSATTAHCFSGDLWESYARCIRRIHNITVE